MANYSVSNKEWSYKIISADMVSQLLYDKSGLIRRNCKKKNSPEYELYMELIQVVELWVDKAREITVKDENFEKCHLDLTNNKNEEYYETL